MEGTNYSHFVVLSLFMIFLIGLSVEFALFIPWILNQSILLIVLKVVGYNGVGVGMFLNYALAIVTDPGRVRKGWYSHDAPPTEPNVGTDVSIQVSQSIQPPRFCQSCQNYKPPRTHHCKDCRRCVLRMDHHCPWTNNCVGFLNHAHFLRFLIWTSIGCLMVATIIIWRLVEIVLAIEKGTTKVAERLSISELMLLLLPWLFSSLLTPNTVSKQAGEFIATDIEIIVIGMDIVMLMPIASVVWLLTSSHLYWACTNQTTIEVSHRKESNFLVGTRLRGDKNPYDLGFKRNVVQVFGHVWKYWLVPPFPLGRKVTVGDGHSFEFVGSGKVDLLGEIVNEEKML
ncbi:hypothetical protein SmJEL517_g06272 [Synchytrium microbalum]|uniref:Palmitoyltransferase n=1 Tax=Synchytrium microbalum TaxID=1806994 RepID=A0A507BJ48_9FUNG|nr:uncharacterized protein SmJEL517_g06272 [Synchytrium microbalum]TPX30067.1 hypothetical protein SmJEL517_g06272 [Synchytrium microbalum]